MTIARRQKYINQLPWILCLLIMCGTLLTRNRTQHIIWKQINSNKSNANSLPPSWSQLHTALLTFISPDPAT